MPIAVLPRQPEDVQGDSGRLSEIAERFTRN
jgi:hypothetical protein